MVVLVVRVLYETHPDLFVVTSIQNVRELLDGWGGVCVCVFVYI